jgi:SAM-dependent methyltransferase
MSEGPIIDRVRGLDDVQVHECTECAVQFLNTWKDPDRAARFYGSQEGLFTAGVVSGNLKYDPYDKYLEMVRPFISETTRLLEIGPGEGFFLKRVSPLVAEAHACEIAPSHVSRLRADGFHVLADSIPNLTPKTKYDVICMWALLGHLPNAPDYLTRLRDWLAPDGHLFLITPHLLEPLVTFYDSPEHREFFYRPRTQYVFTKKSLRLILGNAGFECTIDLDQMTSLTNHLHWMHNGTPQGSKNDMVNVTLPRPVLRNDTPSGDTLMAILDKVDDYYRTSLVEAGVSDVLNCRAWLA